MWGRAPRPSRRAPQGGIWSKVMTNKSKHTGLGLALGAALGAVFGMLAGHVGAWLAIGIAIGMLLGATTQRKEPECPECAQVHRTHELKGQISRLTTAMKEERISHSNGVARS